MPRHPAKAFRSHLDRRPRWHLLNCRPKPPTSSPRPRSGFPSISRYINLPQCSSAQIEHTWQRHDDLSSSTGVMVSSAHFRASHPQKGSSFSRRWSDPLHPTTTFYLLRRNKMRQPLFVTVRVTPQVGRIFEQFSPTSHGSKRTRRHVIPTL
jgi:hypothetical protein